MWETTDLLSGPRKAIEELLEKNSNTKPVKIHSTQIKHGGEWMDWMNEFKDSSMDVNEGKYRIEFPKIHLDMDFGRWGLEL